jgi:hypothetical protein
MTDRPAMPTEWEAQLVEAYADGGDGVNDLATAFLHHQMDGELPSVGWMGRDAERRTSQRVRS